MNFAGFENLVEKECDTCTKVCKVSPGHTGEVECQNCYITKLEYLQKEKEDNERKAKVLPITKRQAISGS